MSNSRRSAAWHRSGGARQRRRDSCKARIRPSRTRRRRTTARSDCGSLATSKAGSAKCRNGTKPPLSQSPAISAGDALAFVPKRKRRSARCGRTRLLDLRECRSAFACSPTRLVLLTCMCASVSAVFCKAVMEGDCAPLCPSRPPCGEKRDRERMIRVRQSRLATNGAASALTLCASRIDSSGLVGSGLWPSVGLLRPRPLVRVENSANPAAGLGEQGLGIRLVRS